MGVFDFFRSVGKRIRGRSGRFLPGSIREVKIDKRLLAPELGGRFVHPKVVRAVEPSAEDEFLYFGKWYSAFSSSNIAAFRYMEKDQILFVKFLNGAIYGYEPVTIEMAKDAYDASSKGSWVWDRLRIRGTAYGHQVRYYYDQGQSTHVPLYRLEGGEREARHDREALAEGGSYTGYFTGTVPDEDTGFSPGWRE